MKLELLINKGFRIKSDTFSWNENRASIREKLKNQHSEDDRIIDMSEYNDGDSSHNIDQKRDIYENINDDENYFFLSYNQENQLDEIEFHWGVEIQINDSSLKFDEDIDNYLNELKLQGHNFKEIEEGNYLFRSLKLTIANADSTGGEGNGLSYLYASQNISHLLDDEEKKLEYFDIIDSNIEKHGFHITYIPEEKDFTPFGYSTGLYKTYGIPEVFVSGLPNGLTTTLITNYAKTFKNQEILLNQKLDNLIDKFTVYLSKVKTQSLQEHVLSSFRLYNGSNFDSIQVIYPDLNGFFPEDDGYDYDMEIFIKS
jgi:hypothetical protein